MTLSIIRSTAFLLGLLFAISTIAATELTLTCGVNDEDGIILDSRSVQSYVDIQNHGSRDTTIRIDWRIMTDTWMPLMEMDIPLKISGGSTRRAYTPWFEYPGPGFYRISASTGRKADGNSSEIVVGIDPEDITTIVDSESDFEAFWNESLNALADIEPDITLTEETREASAKTTLYRVEMTSWDGLRVRGWLEVPKQKGKFPTLIRVPGYRSVREPIDRYDDMVIFSFNPRSHGESDDTTLEPELDFWVRGLYDHHDYFYRGAYLDCIRAVDFLMTRKEVDRKKIAIWGGSQGGGFAFATAALDDRIDLCIADIPWMSEWPGYFAITHWPEISDWMANHPEQNWESMLRTLSYFDTKNMAERISCPVIMSVGLQDDICPPMTSFMTYNLVKSNKEYTVYRDTGHWYPDGHKDDRFNRIRHAFKLD